MENLSEKALVAIGGGGVFDGNSGSMGISLSATADSLLSVTFTGSYGDYKNSTTLSTGNNIDLNLGFLSNKQ